MKTRKGTFKQRKNRTEGVSKSKPKTQTKAKKTLGFNELVFKKARNSGLFLLVVI